MAEEAFNRTDLREAFRNELETLGHTGHNCIRETESSPIHNELRRTFSSRDVISSSKISSAGGSISFKIDKMMDSGDLGRQVGAAINLCLQTTAQVDKRGSQDHAV